MLHDFQKKIGAVLENLAVPPAVQGGTASINQQLITAAFGRLYTESTTQLLVA